jgi:parallel beta-helix repeat protein
MVELAKAPRAAQRPARKTLASDIRDRAPRPPADSARVRRRGFLALGAGFASAVAWRAVPTHAAPVGQTVVCAGFDADAIDSALAAAGPFGDVFLPEGTYLITRTIAIPSDGVSLHGAGDATVLQARDETFNLLYLAGRANVTVRALRIVGAGRDGPGGIGVLADSCQALDLDSLTLQACGSSDASGIQFVSTRFSRIANSTFENNGRGILLYNGAANNVIDACSGHANVKEMIFLTEGCTDCTISNCKSDGDGSGGAAVSIAVHKSNRSVLSGSTVLRSGHEQGVEIAAGDDNVVSNCTISDSNWAGLHIVNSQRTTIVGNVITGNQQAGILLRSAGDASEVRPSDGCTIVANVIAGNNPTGRTLPDADWSGIEVERGNNVRIERNLLRDNHAVAIHVSAGNSGTQIHQNVVDGRHTAVLVDEGTSTSSDIA